MFKEKEKGFTLIELLVVIAIIGILAEILFVAINPKAQTDKAKEKKALAQLTQVKDKAGIIFSDNNYSFADLKNNSDIKKMTDNVQSNEISWAANINLPNNKKACSDSSGYIGKTKNIIEMTFGKYFCSEGEPEDGESSSSICENISGNFWVDGTKAEGCYDITESQCNDLFPGWTFEIENDNRSDCWHHKKE